MGNSVFSKRNNQYFAELFEVCVIEALGGVTDFEIDFDFSDSDRRLVEKDAEVMAECLRDFLEPIESVEYCGRHTIAATGDILVNGQSVELKYTDSSSGTYHNTSIRVLEDFGLPPYYECLAEGGFYEQVEEIIAGLDVLELAQKSKGKIGSLSQMMPKRGVLSPFDNVQRKVLSSEVRRQIGEVEGAIRQDYVRLFQERLADERVLEDFVSMMLSKQTLSGTSKGMPDFLAVFNRASASCFVVPKSEILARKGNIGGVVNTDKGVNIAGVFRVQIGWQNGNGLTNPTVRVFLNK